MDNKNKIILDLCGGTGAWSRPWKKAGYTVFNVTWPDYDVRMVSYQDDLFHLCSPYDKAIKDTINMDEVVGILAAPPCTMFSDARTNAKQPRDLQEGMEVVQACVDIIYHFQYRTKSDQSKVSPLKFWALENPWYGRLRWFLGNPPFIFDPYEFGDAYKKRTAIWGYFNEPKKNPVDMTKKMLELCKTNSRPLPKFDYMKSKDIHPEAFGKMDRQARRSITPAGFANAFYKANP